MFNITFKACNQTNEKEFYLKVMMVSLHQCNRVFKIVNVVCHSRSLLVFFNYSNASWSKASENMFAINLHNFWHVTIFYGTRIFLSQLDVLP